MISSIVDLLQFPRSGYRSLSSALQAQTNSSLLATSSTYYSDIDRTTEMIFIGSQVTFNSGVPSAALNVRCMKN